jgi:hypothetical protein
MVPALRTAAVLTVPGVTGQAGVVSSMVNATRPPSTWRSFTKPSATMSRWRSGSITLRSASNTADWSTDDMGTSFTA